MKKKFLLSAIIISASNFIAKIIGCIYRIPLTNLLGAEGIGLYQMIFPLYCALLDLSGGGVPSALSKIIASEQNNKLKIVKSALKLMFLLGIFAFLIMVILAYPLSVVQGNKNAFAGYLFLSPSVLFVSLLSVFRGYFQGQLNMFPTAISTVVEQVFKVIFGLIFAYLFIGKTIYQVAGATFSITISELIALLIIFLIFLKGNNKLPKIYNKLDFKNDAKSLLKISIPISLTSILLPLSQLIDSALIINILNKYTVNATGLYGIFSGSVMSIINLPVSLFYGISVAIIPIVSKKEGSKKAECLAIFLTIMLSFVAFLVAFTYSNQIISVLYYNFNSGQVQVGARLLKITSVVVILLSLLQTTNAILIGKGKQNYPLISLGVGIVIKCIINLALLPNQKINIYSASYALIGCYLVAVILNLVYYYIIERKKGKNAS